MYSTIVDLQSDIDFAARVYITRLTPSYFSLADKPFILGLAVWLLQDILQTFVMRTSKERVNRKFFLTKRGTMLRTISLKLPVLTQLARPQSKRSQRVIMINLQPRQTTVLMKRQVVLMWRLWSPATGASQTNMRQHSSRSSKYYVAVNGSYCVGALCFALS